MLPLLAIPIVGQATEIASSSSSFFAQPIDAILFDLLIWFGWIPIVVTVGWGFSQVWLSYRQGIFSSKLKFTLLAIDVPTTTEQTPKALENLFATLYGTKSSATWKEKWLHGKFFATFSFEIISSEGYIQFLIRCQSKFRDVIEAGIYAHYPEAEISEVEDYADKFPNEFPNDTHEMWGGEMTFDKPSMYPIRTYIDFEDRMSQEIKDPLGISLEQMAKMKAGEHFWIQILVQPSSQDWQQEGVKHVRKIYGDEDKPKKSALIEAIENVFAWPAGLIEHTTGMDLSALFGTGGATSEDDPWKAFKITLPQKDEAEAILRKTTKVGHGVKIRILYVAQKNSFVKGERAPIIKGILNSYSHLNFNKFGLYGPQVPKDDYFWMRWSYTKKQHRLMTAYQKRSWGIGANPIWMNVEELATLWHFPTIAIKAPLIKKSESKRAEPPTGLPITFLEETLPGYVPADSEPAEDENDSGLPPGIAFAPVDEASAEEHLPQLQPSKQMTDQNIQPAESDSVPESQKQAPDAFDHLVEPTPESPTKAESADNEPVPPNLPI